MSHFPAHLAFTVILRGPRPRLNDLEEGSDNGSRPEPADIPVARKAAMFYAFCAAILCSAGKFLCRAPRCVVACSAFVYHTVFLLRIPSTPSYWHSLDEFISLKVDASTDSFSRDFDEAWKRFIDVQVKDYGEAAGECMFIFWCCIVCMALNFSTSGISYAVLVVLWFTVCISTAAVHVLSYEMKKHLLDIRDDKQLALNFHTATIKNSASSFVSTFTLLAIPHAWKAWTYACGISSFILFIWHSAASGTLPIIVAYSLQWLSRWSAHDAQALEPPQLVDPQATWVPVAARYVVVALSAFGAVHGALVCLQFSELGFRAEVERTEEQSGWKAGSQSRSSSRDATRPEHEERDSV